MTSQSSSVASIEVISPGRINLIGEHTDYNDGYVLPAAVQLHVYVHLRRNNSENKCTLFSNTLQAGLEADLENLQPGKGWENYVLGVLSEVKKRTPKLRGFDGRLDSDLPAGAGLSSSAALECGLAFGLNELFNLNLSPMEIIRLSQLAEHRFAGTQCGILDQFACVMGRKDHFILLDCRSMEYYYLPSNLGDYQLLLINSKISHSHSESGYNQRLKECQKGVAILQEHFPGIRSLRDASLEHLQAVRDTLPQTIFRRCRYVIEENARVLKAVECLEHGDLEALGNLLTQTHRGLQKLYEVSCPELDFLVENANTLPGVLGARMMGGGFGGCCLIMVHRDAFAEVQKHLLSAYFRSFDLKAEPLEVRLGDGVRLRS